MVPMRTWADALRAVGVWERRHGHSAKDAYYAFRYGNTLPADDLSAPSREAVEEGASLYDESRRALRFEARLGRMTQVRLAERFTADILCQLSRCSGT